MTVTRGTSNTNDRGSAQQRRQRKNWVFERWGAEVDVVTYDEWNELVDAVLREAGTFGEPLWLLANTPAGYVAVRKGLGRRAVRCFRCGDLLTDETLECDRIIPAAQKSKKYPMGGRYTKNNVRPVCGKDNKIIAGEEKRKANAKRKARNARRRDLRRKCGVCGAVPAAGNAAVTQGGTTTWYCHPDEGFSCYSGDVA